MRLFGALENTGVMAYTGVPIAQGASPVELALVSPLVSVVSPGPPVVIVVPGPVLPGSVALTAPVLGSLLVLPLTPLGLLVVSAPVGTVVNTHANGDHCYGNQLVDDAEIIASTATAEEMSEVPPAMLAALNAAEGEIGALFRRFFGSFRFEGIELRLPTRTFERRLDVEVGGRLMRVDPRPGGCLAVTLGPGRLDLRGLAPGCPCWLSSDPQLEGRLQRLAERTVAERSRPLSLRVRGRVGAPLTVEVIGADGLMGGPWGVESELPLRASRRPGWMVGRWISRRCPGVWCSGPAASPRASRTARASGRRARSLRPGKPSSV